MPDHAPARAEMLTRRAVSLRPNTFDANARTVEVVWTTGADVERRDAWTGETYVERLRVSAHAIDLSRLNAGAPVLDSHQGYALAGVVGVVERAWIAGREGRAIIRFSEREDVAPIVRDVEAGILRNISVGYAVAEWRDIAPTATTPRIKEAVRWTPAEISFVAIPADPAAGVRSAAILPPQHAEGLSSMHTPAPATPAPSDHAAAVAETRAAELNRAKDIRSAVRGVGLPPEFGEALIERGVSLSDAQSEILRHLSSQRAGAPKPAHIEVLADHDSPGAMIEGMADALAARMLRQAPQGAGQRYAGWPVSELLRELAERRGINTRGSSPAQIVDKVRSAPMTSSDMPILLSSSVSRVLLQLYTRAMSPLRRFLCAEREVPDYRQFRIARVSEFPLLRQVIEGANIEFGALTETGETGAVADFARNLEVSNVALVNDDLGAIEMATRAAAVAAAEAEATALVTLLTSNAGAGPTLADGSALFTTARGNLAAAGTALDVTNLAAARQAIRTQRSIDNAGPVGVAPTFVLVGPAQETAIEQLLQPVVVATTVANGNPFPNAGLTPLVEARLTGNPWYLFAKPEDASVFEVAYLNGQKTPTVETFTGPEILGMTMRVKHSFGAYCVGWRGSYRNAGT